MGAGNSNIRNEPMVPPKAEGRPQPSTKKEKNGSGTLHAAESAVLPNVTKQPCGDYSNNPGTYEDLFKVFKEITPVCFDGAKLIVNRPLSSHFQINHNLTMNANSSMKFGASYIGTNQYLSNEIEKNAISGFQLSTDHRTTSATASLHCVNVDLLRSQGIFIMQYLQRVTSRISLGTEYFYQIGQQIPCGHIGMTSLAARYAAPNWFACASINPSGMLRLGYHHRELKSPLQFGVELESNLSTLESVATCSYAVELAKANCTFKAYADSNWTVGATLEKRLAPMPFSFMLSGVVNNVKHAFKFGVGFIIGS